MAKKAHVSEAKKKQLAELESLMEKYKVVGLADITSLPSSQLQQIKYKLRGKLLIKIFNKNIMKLVFASHKDRVRGIDDLVPLLENGIPAILLTNEAPFQIAKAVNKSKTKAAAKAGQISPVDITLPAGPTPFPAGPMIGELSQMGIKTMVEAGKISVREDTRLVDEGEQINAKVADLITKLGILPMEIGLKITALLDQGITYHEDVLSVDEKKYIEDLKRAYMESLGLAIHLGYANKETINRLIKKAYIEETAIEKKLNIKDIALEEVSEAIQEPSQEVKEQKNTGGIPQYSEEMAKKAQDIIEKLKDEDIKNRQ